MSGVMKKVKVCLKINDYKLEKDGMLNNDILSFQDEDELKTEMIYDWNTDRLIRDNDEMKLEINFQKEKEVIYLLKKWNKKLHQKIEVLKWQKEKNKVIATYWIEKEPFDFTLSYEEDRR